jgi:hypothetical protein
MVMRGARRQSSGKLNSPKFQNQKNLSLVVARAQTFPFPKPNQVSIRSDPQPQPQPIRKAGDTSPSQLRIGCSTQLRVDTLINTQILTAYSQSPQKCRLQDLLLHTATHLPRLAHLRPITMAILHQHLNPFPVVPPRLVRAPLAQVAVVDHELPPQ